MGEIKRRIRYIYGEDRIRVSNIIIPQVKEPKGCEERKKKRKGDKVKGNESESKR